MRIRYQKGSLETQTRANGPDVWLYRWRERVNGKSIRKGVILGTVSQYPTEAKALRAADEFRISANADAPLGQTETFGLLIDRYIAEEISRDNRVEEHPRSARRCSCIARRERSEPLLRRESNGCRSAYGRRSA